MFSGLPDVAGPPAVSVVDGVVEPVGVGDPDGVAEDGGGEEGVPVGDVLVGCGVDGFVVRDLDGVGDVCPPPVPLVRLGSAEGSAGTGGAGSSVVP